MIIDPRRLLLIAYICVGNSLSLFGTRVWHALLVRQKGTRYRHVVFIPTKRFVISLGFSNPLRTILCGDAQLFYCNHFDNFGHHQLFMVVIRNLQRPENCTVLASLSSELQI